MITCRIEWSDHSMEDSCITKKKKKDEKQTTSYEKMKEGKWDINKKTNMRIWERERERREREI